MREVFQSDSEIVNQVYENNDNFCIEYSNSKPKTFCVIYFASNNIYYPNEETIFRKSILEQNRYEWKNQKIEYAYKHIFIRDIKKQWYLSGVNKKLDSPEKLLNHLRQETENYRVLTVGSSAGGYAAVLFGQLLGAEKIFSFNGQFELSSLLQTSSEMIDPLIFRNRSNSLLLPYYNLKNFIKNPISIHYFVSLKSDWDKSQYLHIRDLKIQTVFFKTCHHGVPFPKIALNKILNFNEVQLKNLHMKSYSPILFSLQNGGYISTINFLFLKLFKKYFNKIII